MYLITKLLIYETKSDRTKGTAIISLEMFNISFSVVHTTRGQNKNKNPQHDNVLNALSSKLSWYL